MSQGEVNQQPRSFESNTVPAKLEPLEVLLNNLTAKISELEQRLAVQTQELNSLRACQKIGLGS